MVPIRHEKCNALVAYYLKNEGLPGDVVRAKDVMHLDGTQPLPGSLFNLRCPKCGPIHFAKELRRCFDEPMEE